MDENFVAKLLDVGEELSFPSGHVVVDADHPRSGLLLVMLGTVTLELDGREEERGPGNVIGRWERLDGSDDVRVVAQTDVRLVAVDHAAWEAAQTG